MRALASLGAAVSLPWALGARLAGSDRNIPLWIAVASVLLQLLTIILQFIVEFAVLYQLSPKLGEYVCGAFNDELQTMKTQLTLPLSPSLTVQVSIYIRIYTHLFKYFLLVAL
jgi:hypothetical protein